MSFAVSSLRDALGVPSTKVFIGVTTFASYILPPVVCYFIAAGLAVAPRMRALQVAIWPVVALLAFRALVSVDMSNGDPDLKYLNMDTTLLMVFMVVHSFSWTFAKKPLVRYLRPANSTPSAILDALDLATSFRGHGWEWPRGLYIPRETRPTNRMAFACYALFSGAAHGIIYGALYTAIATFTGSVGPTSHGFPMFDDTLPFLVRYLRASIIGIMCVFSIHAVLQLGYDLFSVFGVLLLGQDPAQWPPAFDSPWFATSLNDFWGRRWHQFFRHMYLAGAYPFTVVLGRAGTVIGAFLSSGVHHHVLNIATNDNSEMWKTLVPFGMMVPGIFAERAFYRYTGKKVGGVVGWVWTMAWLLLWGNVMVDGFVRAGMFASLSTVQSFGAMGALVRKLVIDFDAWLHTL